MWEWIRTSGLQQPVCTLGANMWSLLQSKYLLLTTHTILVTVSSLCSFTVKLQKMCLYSPSTIFHLLFSLTPTPMNLLSTETVFIQATSNFYAAKVYLRILACQPEICFKTDHSLFLELLPWLPGYCSFSSGFPSILLATFCLFNFLILHCVPNISMWECFRARSFPPSFL